MKRIDKNKVKVLQEKKKKHMIVDMRSPIDFRDSHVENSVNLPLTNFANKLLTIPKDTTLILYSKNIKDIDLEMGVKYAVQVGFENIFVSDFDSLK
jgi:tRNA 2-selenouridine synthase SelU